MKLTSDLKKEEKRVQELEQRVAESELNDDAFKRIPAWQDDVKEQDEEIKELNFELEKEQKQKKSRLKS